MWGSCLQRLPSQAEYEIALLQSDSSITCCLKSPFAAEVKELLKTHSKVQSSKSCGDFREVLFLLFQKREKSKSEGFFYPFLLSPCFPTLPQPALSPPFPSPSSSLWGCVCWWSTSLPGVVSHGLGCVRPSHVPSSTPFPSLPPLPRLSGGACAGNPRPCLGWCPTAWGACDPATSPESLSLSHLYVCMSVYIYIHTYIYI